MRVSLGGSVLEIVPDCHLNASEREALAPLVASEHMAVGPDFRLEIIPADGWTPVDPCPPPLGEPARVRVAGDRVAVSHQIFEADLDPWLRQGCLVRLDGSSAALEITLRVALSSLLPLSGGLPLHAAGVAVRTQGLVFFGPSGAGKSTVAECSPFPVFSDELVVVRGDPFVLRRSGFWGSYRDAKQVPPAQVPLRALFKLDRGPRFELVRLDPAEAWRQLTEVVIIPGLPRLWRHAAELLARLVGSVPTFRMRWHPASPPWADLSAALSELEPPNQS
ncbi:MAG TPA: hypothetical protein PLP31_13485 [Thermoanaerobaculaceae bacterium]|mgnify:CR=1 FL=1|nr:hypothetical protein [Thermoanaerobaculaceae bacterium]